MGNEKEAGINGRKVLFNYVADEVKYYLLTSGSGYPLADFTLPGQEGLAGPLIVPERRLKTANTNPSLDTIT